MPRNDSAFTTTTLNALTIVASTASTNSTTGAIVCPGGVGIGGNLNVAGTITGGAISYASTSTGTLDVTNGTGTTLNVDSTEECTGIGTGAAIFDGGVYIAKNLHVGGTVTAGAITYASTSTGTLAVTTSPGNTVVVSSTEDSTSKTTGSITTPGGIGAGKKISAGSLTTYDTTQSTSISTGTIITPGGIGAAGNVFVGGTLNAGNITLAGSLVNNGFELIMGNGDPGPRGDSGSSRALVKDFGNVLVLNYAQDFTGGARVDGPISADDAFFATCTAAGYITLGTAALNNITSAGTAALTNVTASGTTGVQSLTVGTTLGVTGATTLSTLSASGAATTTGITNTGSVSTTGSMINRGFDFILGNIDNSRGNSGNSRALTKDTGNILVLNYAGDFTGGTRIDSALSVVGNLSTTTTLTATTGATIGGTSALTNLTVSGTAGFATLSSSGVGNFQSIQIGGTLAVAKNVTVLEFGNDSNDTLLRGIVSVNGFDLKLGTGDNITRGSSGASRALVKEADLPDSKLVVNYAGDFSFVEVQSPLTVTGAVSGSNLQIAGVPVAEFLSSQYNLGVDGSDLVLRGVVNVKGYDLRLSKGDTGRGDSGESRAMVHGFSNQLIINFGGDFTGGVEIQSDVVANNFYQDSFSWGVTWLPNIPGTIQVSEGFWQITGSSIKLTGVFNFTTPYIPGTAPIYITLTQTTTVNYFSNTDNLLVGEYYYLENSTISTGKFWVLKTYSSPNYTYSLKFGFPSDHTWAPTSNGFGFYPDTNTYNITFSATGKRV